MESGILTVTRRSDTLWIMLPESINFDNSKAVENSIEKNCNGATQRVALDFSRINNLYSSGLGLLIRVRKFVQDKNGELYLVNVSERLREMFLTLNLDRVFTIYATDVEYEINQECIWKCKKESLKLGFIFISRVEDKYCRINISGEMTSVHDLSRCRSFQPVHSISVYIIDLTSLEQIDSNGAYLFREITSRIAQEGATCRVFGIDPFICETLNLFDSLRYSILYRNEKDALNGSNPV